MLNSHHYIFQFETSIWLYHCSQTLVILDRYWIHDLRKLLVSPELVGGGMSSNVKRC